MFQPVKNTKLCPNELPPLCHRFVVLGEIGAVLSQIGCLFDFESKLAIHVCASTRLDVFVSKISPTAQRYAVFITGSVLVHHTHYPVA